MNDFQETQQSSRLDHRASYAVSGPYVSRRRRLRDAILWIAGIALFLSMFLAPKLYALF